MKLYKEYGVNPFSGCWPVLLQFPILISNVLPNSGWGVSVRDWVNDNLYQPSSAVYIASYGALIILFAYFYTAIQFDPHRQADQIRKQGGFIPGIRPGIQTERYLGKVVRGDLGRSLYTTRDIADDLVRRLPATLELTFAAMVLTVVLGVPIGVLTALRRKHISNAFGKMAGRTWRPWSWLRRSRGTRRWPGWPPSCC